MKRERPNYRRMVLRAPFIRPGADDQPGLARVFSRTAKQPERRKIFVVKQTSRLPSTNEKGKKIRRILIYDNHPDSLRLVFGRRLDPFADPSRPRRVGVGFWELVIASILMIAGLVGMFWPAFEIFAP